MLNRVQESLKRSKDERQKKRLKRNGFVLRKPQQKQLVRKRRLQQEAQKIQTEKRTPSLP